MNKQTTSQWPHKICVCVCVFDTRTYLTLTSLNVAIVLPLAHITITIYQQINDIAFDRASSLIESCSTTGHKINFNGGGWSSTSVVEFDQCPLSGPYNRHAYLQYLQFLFYSIVPSCGHVGVPKLRRRRTYSPIILPLPITKYVVCVCRLPPVINSIVIEIAYQIII